MERRLKEILKIALDHEVTDIHFSINAHQQEDIVIEMRVNGVMRQLKKGQGDLKLFRYLMYRANLDVSDILDPQTGSLQEIIDQKLISCRFAVVSSYHMISGVLRILNNHTYLQINDLCSDPSTIQWLQTITQHRHGLFIFSGPTGSGKTTSLYTLLNACTGKKIFTLEDPVEVVNENYVQLQINEKQHLSYAEGIKQLMRHDPDIIMVGEIRDDLAAKMTVRCALTGHLVITSLHSSSCISALHRMEDLGIERYQLEDVLMGISNQRLFDCGNGKKTGIYEFMDKKELDNYFERGKTDAEFKSLQYNIQQAILRGTITSKQAQADMLA